jgi:hypothetical protein
MNRRLEHLLPASFALVFVYLSVVPCSGQEREREDLKQPVFRVSKSEDLSNTSSTTPPLSEVAPAQAAVAGPSATDPSLAAADPNTTGQRPPATAAAAPDAPQVSESQTLLQQALDEANIMLQHIRDNVRDYRCILIKRENVKGTVQATEFIKTKIRNRKVVDGKLVTPFSVYMKFIKPANMAGREVLFVESQNDSKMMAREGGPRGRLLPPVWLNTDGRLAMKTNRYPITEVGIENLTVRLLERGQQDLGFVDDCVVRYGRGAKVCGRVCKYLEVVRPTPKTGKALEVGMNVYLVQVFVDEEQNIPIRYGAYDWPVAEGSQPDVIEEYTYQNLELNVGLTDADFDHKNPEYKF